VEAPFSDPLIVNGEMVAQCHRFYGSAAPMMVIEVPDEIQKK
jgi:hypothetical protein